MIKNKINRSFIFLFVVVSTLNAFGEEKVAESEAFNPTPQILHHIADSYEWHLWGNVSIPLPVILYSEGNWDIFMSSAFHHGKSKVFKGDRIYKIDHHHIIEEQGKKFIKIGRAHV